MYQYKATVEKWIDGDTVDLLIDLGLKVSTKQRFRVLDLDTPERKEPGFMEAKDLAEKTLPIGTEIIVETHKTDKYGRWLVSLPMVVVVMNQHKLNKITNQTEE